MGSKSKTPHPVLASAVRALNWPVTYLVMSIGILLIDLVTGPYLLFPITFVIPVALSAWFYSTRWAYALSVLLPAGRFLIADFVDRQTPLLYMVRIAVLLFMAYLVGRTARQTRQLQEQVSDLLRICAWTRTVEFQGEWISFEEYLRRRFGIKATHGMSPEVVKKFLAEVEGSDATPIPPKAN
jgi:hypothetical protein